MIENSYEKCKNITRFFTNKKVLKMYFKNYFCDQYLSLKSWFWGENRDFFENLENTSFLTFSTKKVSKNGFFDQNLNFSEKFATSAPVWYFHFPRTPNGFRDFMLQSLLYTFSLIHGHPNFNTLHILIFFSSSCQHQRKRYI